MVIMFMRLTIFMTTIPILTRFMMAMTILTILTTTMMLLMMLTTTTLSCLFTHTFCWWYILFLSLSEFRVPTFIIRMRQ